MQTHLAKFPILIGLLILLLTIPLSLMLTTQKSPVNPKLKAQDENPLLFIFPQSIPAAKVDQELTLTLNIDTKGNSINGIDVRLRYNPFMFRIDQKLSETGAIFANYPGKIMVDQKKGLVSISGKGNFTGKGIFAKLSLFTLSAGSGEILRESISSGQLYFDYVGVTILVAD